MAGYRFRLLFSLLLPLAGFAVISLARASDPGGLWPRYRHDAALTGFSPLKGGLGEAPKVLWTVDLGGPAVAAEQVRLEDLNGDGKDELLRILPDRLICQDVRGK